MNKLRTRMIGEVCCRAMEEHGYPGLSIAIVQGGRIGMVTGWGKQRIGEPRSVDGDTLFHMASITKTFTGTGIMQLVSEGAVGLDDLVWKKLPDFCVADRRFRSITVRHLLTHTSGIPDVTDFGWDRPEYDDGALGRHIAGLSGVRLLSVPGRRYSYSDLGFEVLGHLIARVSGISFEEYIRENILIPAGMSSSTLLNSEVDHRRLARPHVGNREDGIRPGIIFPYNRRHAPSSTLYSSAQDMAMWMRVLLSRGKGIRERIILPSSSYRAMWRRSNVTNGNFWLEVGAGFFAGRTGRCRFVGHEGSDSGFRSSMAVFPGLQIGVTIAANHDADRLKGVMEKLFAILI